MSLKLCPFDTALQQYYTGVDAGLRFMDSMGLVSRIRGCADNLRGCRERDTVQRTAKSYDDDGDDKYVELRLMPLLAAVIMAARALPPSTSRRRMTKKRGAGRK